MNHETHSGLLCPLFSPNMYVILLSLAITCHLDISVAGIYLLIKCLILAVQSLTCVQLFAIPWTKHARLPCSSLSPGISSNSCPLSQWCFLNYLIHCCPLLLLALIFASIKVFSTRLALCIKWPKYWSFSFSINPSNEYSGLISFRTDWFDLLAVQGTLKSLLQPHNSKASILQHSAFFMVQLLHLYMTTGKTIALTMQMMVSNVMSLLFNMLSRFVIRAIS